MDSNQDKILLVDDEQAVLDGLRRQHRKRYSLTTACGPEAGLEALAADGPFAVVVTDYQMPGMSGTEFLTKVREREPDVVRLMLTGQADLKTSIEAVNRGQIFRFLTKPCDPSVFVACVDAALEQHRLRQAERQLLEHTVKGSIEVLSEVLALSNPGAFGKAARISSLVSRVVAELRLPEGWKYETAALLSQIGCVAIPADILERMAAGEDVPVEQMAMLDKHPALARDLLKKIPRFQEVAEMVYHQNPTGPRKQYEPKAVAGGRILAAALAFDELVALGAAHEQAIEALRKDQAKYDPKVLDVLASSGSDQARRTVIRSVELDQLEAGMILQDGIRNRDGGLIVACGHELSVSSLLRIMNYVKLKQVACETLRVKLTLEDDAGEDGLAA